MRTRAPMVTHDGRTIVLSYYYALNLSESTTRCSPTVRAAVVIRDTFAGCVVARSAPPASINGTVAVSFRLLDSISNIFP